VTTTYADFVAAEIAKLVPVATTPEEAEGYGSDLVCVTDIDPGLAMTDPLSTEGLAQDAFHRITTKRGSLPDDLDYGINVIDFLSTPDDDTTLLMQAGLIRLELKKDDRFSSVEVSVTASGGVRYIAITITPEDVALGVFSMIVTVTQAGSTLELV
jgi:hypothetical protein